MKEPELILKAKEADREAKGKVILGKQIHSKLIEIMKEHGDEVVFGGPEDYLLKVDLNSGGLSFRINAGSETDNGDLPYVHLSFESQPKSRTIVFLEQHEPAVVDANYEVFRKIARMRGGKQGVMLNAINLRRSTREDLIQFAEITDLLADAVKDRVGEIDPVGFQNRLRIIA